MRTRCRIADVSRRRRGFTLAELLLASVILTLVLSVLAGVTQAVHTAWNYSTTREDCRLEAQAAVERIQWMLRQAGTYRLAGGPTVFGVRSVTIGSNNEAAPAVLVIWSGGRNGGLASQGVLSRLPRINELVIYGCDPQQPREFVELTIPGNTQPIAFNSPLFADNIKSLMAATGQDRIRLCRRIRIAPLTIAENWPGLGGVNQMGLVRMDAGMTPTDDAIAAASPGTTAWQELPWSQGLVSPAGGLRAVRVLIELQLEPAPEHVRTDAGESLAIPFFGLASARYVHQP